MSESNGLLDGLFGFLSVRGFFTVLLILLVLTFIFSLDSAFQWRSIKDDLKDLEKQNEFVYQVPGGNTMTLSTSDMLFILVESQEKLIADLNELKNNDAALASIMVNGNPAPCGGQAQFVPDSNRYIPELNLVTYTCALQVKKQ